MISEAIVRRKKCQSCDAYGICEGGCNNVAYNETGVENNGGITCKIFRHVYKYISSFINSNDYRDLKNPISRDIFRKRSQHFDYE